MNSHKQKIGALLALGFLVGATGCGENILTAGAKVASGEISQLSANEIMILNQTLIDVLAAENPDVTVTPLTEPQAEALSNFFQANSLDTPEDFTALEQTAQTDPASIQGVTELAAAFSAELDPDNFDPAALAEILGALFGGS